MNELVHSHSPYLKQHAYNPVHWKEWSNEAFDEAKKRNKPVLVSIGYASCHWCHVMEKESFEDHETAEYMNTHFVCIKVDREEWPHVDKFYMDALQSMNQQGGWPLNVFVTPEKLPFYGGTYFPQKPMYNRPSWRQVLEAIQHAWQDDASALIHQGEMLKEHIQNLQSATAGSEIGQDLKDIDTAWYKTAFMGHFDEQYGGWYTAPKFPQFLLLNNLIHQYAMTLDEGTHKAIQLFWHGIFNNGLWDNTEGGLYRYAVDREWHIPHFEKMLYDNALFVDSLCLSIEMCGMQEFLPILKQQIHFLNTSMRLSNGLFITAIDADSEGIEGYYYVLTENEFKSFLEQGFDERLYLSKEIYHHDKIYYKISTLSFYANSESAIISEINAYLYAIRKEAREYPLIDDKAILSLNAMVLKAYINAYKLIGSNELIRDIEDLFERMFQHFSNEGSLCKINYHTRVIPAQADDIIHFVDAALQLYMLTGLTRYFDITLGYFNELEKQFLDNNSGLLKFNSDANNDIPVTQIDTQDNIIPSMNSVYVSVKLLIGLIESNQSHIYATRQTYTRMYKSMLQFPQAHANWWLNYTTQKEARIFKINRSFDKKIYENLRNNHGKLAQIVWEVGRNDIRGEVGEMLIQQCFEDKCTVIYKGDGEQFEK